MAQTIIVFILFFGVIAYYGYQFFKKPKAGEDTACAKCSFAKKPEHL